MEYQDKQWVILEEDEECQVWKKINDAFHFSPSINPQVKPFNFKIDVRIYDISESSILADDEKVNTIIRTGFIKAMGNDPYMYALDWQHTCFRRMILHYEN